MHPGDTGRVLICYILFVIFEFGIFFLVMKNYVREYYLSGIVIAELVLIPLYQTGGANDFVMRVSIPPLFMLMIYLMKYFQEDVKKESKYHRIIAYTVLILGFIVSLAEIERNFYFSLKMEKEEILQIQYTSFGDLGTDNEVEIKLFFDQYLPTDYQQSVYWRYFRR